MRRLIAASLLAIALPTLPADASPHRHRAHSRHVAHTAAFHRPYVRHLPRRKRPWVGKLARPAGCPHAWCGCFLARMLGIPERRLWLARNWAHVGRPAHGPAPGVIAVWRHHVGQVVAVAPRGVVILSGNDGGRVRQRVRSTAGVIAWRSL